MLSLPHTRATLVHQLCITWHWPREQWTENIWTVTQQHREGAGSITTQWTTGCSGPHVLPLRHILNSAQPCWPHLPQVMSRAQSVVFSSAFHDTFWTQKPLQSGPLLLSIWEKACHVQCNTSCLLQLLSFVCISSGHELLFQGGGCWTPHCQNEPLSFGILLCLFCVAGMFL